MTGLYDPPSPNGLDPANRGAEVGRAYAVQNAGWTEKWVTADPALLLGNPTDGWKLPLPPGSGSRDFLDPKDDLDHPLPSGGGWYAMDTFTYTPLSQVPVPQSPPTLPAQQYQVRTWSGANPAVQSGALYRMFDTYVLPGGGTAQWWWDHWVLYGNHQPPSSTPLIALRLAHASATAGNLAQFISGQKSAHSGDPNAKYVVLEMKWKPI